MRKNPDRMRTGKNPRLTFIKSKWKVALLIFFFTFSVRLLTLNRIGKTWDEGAYVELGHKYVELAIKHDFSNPYWYLQSDHPPLARYIYGLASVFDTHKNRNEVEFNTSYTASRTTSAIIGSLTVVFIVLIGYEYFSPFVALSSGLIFALIPFFVGLSQLGTLESPIMLTFTGTIFFFLKFLRKSSRKNIVIAGILLGCAVLVKQSNVILIPLMFLISITRTFSLKQKKKLGLIYLDVKIIFLIAMVALLTCFILWPMPFFHLRELLDVQNKMWVHAVKLPPPEVYFGVLRLVPKQYYVVMFFITTPIVLLLLSMLGGAKAILDRKFIMIVIVIWFLFPFLQMFYAFKQHGVRYIIEIYAPFALLCGIGLEFINAKLHKIKFINVITLTFVVSYLLLVLFKVSPYYLDYFNEIIGGNNYVYQHKLFQMGWWGQGIEEAAVYISQHERKIVTVAVDGAQPATVMPRLWNIKTVYYNKEADFDYVIVPYFNVVRLGFPEEELSEKYMEYYDVMVDKAKLVKVYRRK